MQGSPKRPRSRPMRSKRKRTKKNQKRRSMRSLPRRSERKLQRRAKLPRTTGKRSARRSPQRTRTSPRVPYRLICSFRMPSGSKSRTTILVSDRLKEAGLAPCL
jgi:hypothetical protein